MPPHRSPVYAADHDKHHDKHHDKQM